MQPVNSERDSSGAAVTRMLLRLPAQAAAETEVTVLQWHIAEGDAFETGQPLAEVDSAKSVFDFEAPCHGRVIRLLRPPGEAFDLSQPVAEIETADPAVRDWIPPAAERDPRQEQPLEQQKNEPAAASRPARRLTPASERDPDRPASHRVGLRAVAGYLPRRVVTNEELAERFEDIDAAHIRKVTGMSTRHWARDDE
ncbi:MAG: biotin/lipoyl-containing protein [Pirellulales bacterium]